MLINQHRKLALVLFIATILFMLLTVISLWNCSLKTGVFIFFLLAITSSSVFYIIYLRASNPKQIESALQQKIADERTRMLSEMNKKEEVSSDDTQHDDLKAVEILPKGNFKTLESYSKKLLLNMVSEFQIVIGIVYSANSKGNSFSFLTGYGLPNNSVPADFKVGDGLNGQAASNQEVVVIRDLPEEYFDVESGLGSGKPRNIVLAPVVNNNKTIAFIEFATFIEIDSKTEEFIKKICSLAAEKAAQL
jgi:hypothetical protein